MNRFFGPCWMKSGRSRRSTASLCFSILVCPLTFPIRKYKTLLRGHVTHIRCGGRGHYASDLRIVQCQPATGSFSLHSILRVLNGHRGMTGKTGPNWRGFYSTSYMVVVNTGFSLKRTTFYFWVLTLTRRWSWRRRQESYWRSDKAGSREIKQASQKLSTSLVQKGSVVIPTATVPWSLRSNSRVIWLCRWTIVAYLLLAWLWIFSPVPPTMSACVFRMISYNILTYFLFKQSLISESAQSAAMHLSKLMDIVSSILRSFVLFEGFRVRHFVAVFSRPRIWERSGCCSVSGS